MAACTVSDVTAVTIGDAPPPTWRGASVLVSGRRFGSALDMQRAWFDGVAQVRTPWFFFAESGDELPPNHVEVLAQCRAAPLTYTDELINGVRRVAGPYSRDRHLADALMLHHLTVCDTALAQAALARIPAGHYWPEMQLYWELARQGANYLPIVGYHWNRRDDGLSCGAMTTCAQMRSLLWCRANP